jgi:hypothetical protein
MKATLMRSALALSLVLVSLSACSGGEQALGALKKHSRASLEGFAALSSSWKNVDVQFKENSSTNVSAIMTADFEGLIDLKMVCNYDLTDTNWTLVYGAYYEDGIEKSLTYCESPLPRE